MLRKLFVEHPRSVGETYVQHMGKAIGFGLRMILSGIACIVHGIFPRLFTVTGSSTVAELYDRMVRNRRHAGSDASDGKRSL